MADVPKDIMEAATYRLARHAANLEKLALKSGLDTAAGTVCQAAADAINDTLTLLSERERRNAQGMTWQPIDTYHAADKFTKAQHILLAHAEKRWIRMGRYYPEMKRWYYSGTNERSQWAQIEGDAPTHWMFLPAAPSLSSSAGGGE